MNDKRFEWRYVLPVSLTVCTVFFGMYYEFCGAVMALGLTVAVFIYWRKYREMNFKISVGSALYLLFLLCHILTVFYGVDSGMAFLGLAKILWIAPFLLLYQQMEPERQKSLFDMIPWIGMGIVLIGLSGLVITPLQKIFWVNHRLGGTFQYPNTLAIFLLAGIIILLYKSHTDWKRILCFLILCIGIAATGSRTAMVISALAILTIIVLRKKWMLCVLFFAMLAVGASYILVTGDTATFGRILKLSFSESTFVGRFLYAYDALGLLLRHPFGMGHLGYYYTQNMIQTGVYTIRYVHNDLLQIGLDIGWIPMLAYMWSVCRCICSKALSPDKKWILTVVFLHGLLDFDLAYTVMLCLVFLIMDDAGFGKFGRRVPEMVTLSGRGIPAVSAVIFAVCAYIAIPTVAVYRENYQLAAKIYPWDTEANLHLLSESDDIEEVERLADHILKQNDTCALAYYAKAYAAYCRDDYEGVIGFQRECIARDYFNYEQYLNYAFMLYDGMQFAADEIVREQCRAELGNIPRLLEQAGRRESFLGKHIKDQPELEMDEQLMEMVGACG